MFEASLPLLSKVSCPSALFSTFPSASVIVAEAFHIVWLAGCGICFVKFSVSRLFVPSALYSSALILLAFAISVLEVARAETFKEARSRYLIA